VTYSIYAAGEQALLDVENTCNFLKRRRDTITLLSLPVVKLMRLVSRHVTLTEFGKLLDVQTPEEKNNNCFLH